GRPVAPRPHLLRPHRRRARRRLGRAADRARACHPRRRSRRGDAGRRGILKQARRRSFPRPRQAPGVLPAVPGLDRTPAAYRRRRRRGVGRPLLRAEMDRTGARWPRVDDHARGAARADGAFRLAGLAGGNKNVSGTERIAALIAWTLFVRVDDLVKDRRPPKAAALRAVLDKVVNTNSLLSKRSRPLSR